nr:MAG: hypothetical protein [Metapenaeopsis lamellata majanivirus]
MMEDSEYTIELDDIFSSIFDGIMNCPELKDSQQIIVRYADCDQIMKIINFDKNTSIENLKHQVDYLKRNGKSIKIEYLLSNFDFNNISNYVNQSSKLLTYLKNNDFLSCIKPKFIRDEYFNELIKSDNNLIRLKLLYDFEGIFFVVIHEIMVFIQKLINNKEIDNGKIIFNIKPMVSNDDQKHYKNILYDVIKTFFFDIYDRYFAHMLNGRTLFYRKEEENEEDTTMD